MENDLEHKTLKATKNKKFEAIIIKPIQSKIRDRWKFLFSMAEFSKASDNQDINLLFLAILKIFIW